MKDYYEILGITDEEKKLTGEAFNTVCKKKYHALALKYHPDRWATKSEQEKKEAEEKFKDIAEANEILSDPQKRSQYDNGGASFDFNGFDPMDIFRRATEGFDPFGGGFGFNFGKQVNKGSDTRANVTLTLEEAYNGCKKEVEIHKNIKCDKCNGTGFKDGVKHICYNCHGSGYVMIKRQLAPNQFMSASSPCPECKGSGFDLKQPRCSHCNGTGFKTETVHETIDVPKGVGNNMMFRVEGLGNAPEGDGINGDLLVSVFVKEDPYFSRPDIINLVHYESVPFNEVMLGFKKDFKCIDGSEVTVYCKELTKPGETYFFKGKGMPDPNRPSVRGDYAIVINYKLPNKLTDKQREILKNFDK